MGTRDARLDTEKYTLDQLLDARMGADGYGHSFVLCDGYEWTFDEWIERVRTRLNELRGDHTGALVREHSQGYDAGWEDGHADGYDQGLDDA